MHCTNSYSPYTISLQAILIKLIFLLTGLINWCNVKYLFVYEKRKELKFAIHFITKANKHVEAIRYACLHKSEYWSSLNYVWFRNWSNFALYHESYLKGCLKGSCSTSLCEKITVATTKVWEDLSKLHTGARALGSNCNQKEHCYES